jgi:riboflavin synthase
MLDIRGRARFSRSMFTGIVEGTGKVLALTKQPDGGVRLTLDAGPLADGAKLGDSIAINGCCLTVTEMAGPRLGFDLLAETLACTSLRHAGVGAVVNLERALAANGRYGGHFVSGHVDTTGPILVWQQKGADYELRIGVDPANGRYLVPKGSIAVDGISLTVGDVAPDAFSVWIIPHTREITALHERKIGDHVNLEFDMLAKYTEKILAHR